VVAARAGAAIGIASERACIDRFALVAVGLFAAFAIWVLISLNWASDGDSGRRAVLG
jgi:hypothetical protein